MRILFIAMPFLVAACSQSPDGSAAGPAAISAAPAADVAHNSRNALDWPGTYSGVLPCADCEGIRTVITLNGDGTFRRELEYLGKSDEPTSEAGAFEWDDRGQVVTLAAGKDSAQQYFVGENRLFHLDRDGNRISGELADMYVLHKVQRDSNIADGQ